MAKAELYQKELSSNMNQKQLRRIEYIEYDQTIENYKNRVKNNLEILDSDKKLCTTTS